MAGRLYNVHVKHTAYSGFDQTFMPCSGFFYSLPNNECGTKYRGLCSAVVAGTRGSGRLAPFPDVVGDALWRERCRIFCSLEDAP